MATGRREIPFRLTAENRTQAAFRELRRDVRRVNQLGTSLAGVFGVAFGAAGLASLTQGLRGVFNELDETAKKARELGFEIEELAATRFVGNLVGVDERQLDRIFTRLQNFQALAEQGFARETVSQTLDLNAAAARSLGLSRQAIEGLADRELFTEIVNGLRRIERQSDRVRTATQIAGQRGAQALLRFAALSPAEFAELTEEFRRLGGVNEELAEKAEAVNDVFNLINQANFANLQRELNDLIGPVTEIIRVGRIAALTLGSFGQREQPEANFFESPFGFLIEEAESFRRAVRGAQETVEGIQPDPGPFEQFFSRVGDFFGFFNDEVAEVTDNLLSLAGFGGPDLTEQQQQLRDLASTEDELTRSLQEQERVRQRQLELQRQQTEEQARAQSIADQEAAAAADRLRQEQLRQAALETRQLQQTARFLLGQQPQQQQAGVGTARDFENAVNLAQSTDPNTQLLQGILDELRSSETDAQLRRLVELLPRLNNPVFT